MSINPGIAVDERVIQPDIEIEDDAPTEVLEPPQGEAPSRLSVLGKRIIGDLLPPILGIAAFIALWALVAPRIETRVGSLPGPIQVFDAGRGLFNESVSYTHLTLPTKA